MVCFKVTGHQAMRGSDPEIPETRGGQGEIYKCPFPAWRDPAEPSGLGLVEVEPGHGEGCESLSYTQEALRVCREAGV